jgi:hypothetical protein
LILAAGAVVAAFAIVLLVSTHRDAEPPASPPNVRDAGAQAPPSPPIVVDAPAPPPEVRADAWVPGAAETSARDEREKALAELHDSGLGHEDWDSAAEALLGSIARGPVEATDAGCFIAGCGMTYTFPSEDAYLRGIDELQRSDGFRAWTGGKQFTTPERRADGRVVVALLLYRPD